MQSPEPWKDIARRKKEQQKARIPQAWLLRAGSESNQSNVQDVPYTCGLLNEEEIRITDTGDATALAEKLRTGSLTSLDAVTAFCKRAAIAHQLVNCLTEVFFDEAIVRARELDDHLARTGKPVGPLHGLPISLKDSFRVKGYDASIGIATLCFKECTSNSTLVDLLLAAGAVIYCKTNIPQTLMALDSHNNVFGRTLNPANSRLTAGGSSGGEGALVAMRGSILGIGTDVGGSIRIPAMCHGLYGIKPSHGRVPYAKQEGGAKPGSEALGIRSSAGPIAHSVRDCELLLKVVSDMRAWDADPEVVPQIWNGQMSLYQGLSTPLQNSRIRIGVVRTDGVTTPLPPIAHFIDEISDKLRAHSSTRLPAVEVVELNITTLLGKCQSLANAFFSIEGANNWFDLLAETDEPLSPWLQSRLKRRPQQDLNRVRELQARRNAMQTDFLDIWHSDGGYWAPRPGLTSQGTNVEILDAIICPVAPHPVPEIDRWNTASYTSSFVLLDYPAATLPVRKMTAANLVGEVPDAKPLSSWDKVGRTLWTEVDRNVYLDSPLCIQVVGQKLQERKLLEVMEVLDEVLKSQPPTVSMFQKAKL